MQFIFLFFFLFLFPAVSHAQGLVTCIEGGTCTFCDLLQLIENVLDWLFIVALLIATIGLMYAGARIVYSKGDVNTVTFAKGMLWNIVVGIFLILGAWFLTDMFVKAMVGGNFGVWNQPDTCGVSFEAGDAATTLELDVDRLRDLPQSDRTTTGDAAGADTTSTATDDASGGADDTGTAGDVSGTGDTEGTGGNGGDPSVTTSITLDGTVSNGDVNYTYDPNITYTVYDPPIGDLPAGPEHGLPIEIRGVSDDGWPIIYNPRNGYEGKSSCELIWPRLGGC